MWIGSILTGFRFAKEIVVVATELGGAVYHAVRGGKRIAEEVEADKATTPDIERQRAGSMAAHEESKHAGPRR
jgi:hypothetical protein